MTVYKRYQSLQRPDYTVNTHKRRAPLTARLPLVFSFAHTHIYMLLYILLTSALFISSMLIHSQDRRRLLGAAEALPFSFSSLSLLISLFPSLSFSDWKGSVKGPRWKAALNGSVIAETALAAQGATPNCPLRVAPPYKDAHGYCPICAWATFNKHF